MREDRRHCDRVTQDRHEFNFKAGALVVNHDYRTDIACLKSFGGDLNECNNVECLDHRNVASLDRLRRGCAATRNSAGERAGVEYFPLSCGPNIARSETDYRHGCPVSRDELRFESAVGVHEDHGANIAALKRKLSHGPLSTTTSSSLIMATSR